MDELLVQMGHRIFARRKQLGLNQEELAERAGITSQTVSYALPYHGPFEDPSDRVQSCFSCRTSVSDTYPDNLCTRLQGPAYFYTGEYHAVFFVHTGKNSAHPDTLSFYEQSYKQGC